MCGSQGAEHRLRIKACDSEPYFPFLEHHDPPKGSRLPSKEGIVDSCRVCSAFLCQQWEAYERSHTPAIKRLYWLKRADNGHFTGAEMRLQGEYIAQIMGLQYQPGAFDGRTSPSDFGRERGLREVPQQVRVDRKSADIAREKKNVQFSSTAVQPKTVASIPTNVPLYSSENRSQVVTQKPVPSEGVLDLSVTKKSDTSNTATDDKKQILLCFLCANQISLYDSKVVNSVRQSISEPYFPIIQTIPCIPGALPLNDNGQTRVCVACKNSLFQQWQAYEMSGIPNQHRNYKVFESQELKIIRANAASLTRMHSVELSQARLEHVCYICGNMYPAELIRSLFTSPSTEPSMGTLFFPFVRELSRPAGAEPLRSDGSVLACRNCYEALYKQWQLQEMERVPLAQRQYSLSFLGNKPDLLDSSFRLKQLKDEPILKGRESPKPDLNKPLNIQISENSSEQADTLLASQGLLAIASSGSTNQGDGNEPPKSKSPVKVNKSPSVDSFAKTVPHPLLQATKIPKKICFLCGEKCRLSKAHVLCSYPPRHEAKTMNNQVIPFFPFLANKEPAPKAETMTEDGTVISCDVCFHILIQQWNDYEENKGGNDSNRWLRKYTLPDFVCCLCSRWMKHKNIQLLSCKMYPFLKDIKPNTAPTIEDGLTVGVCTMCAQNLNMQNIEYERMGVPVELRKFNWTKQKELQAQNDDSSDEEVSL